MIRALEKSRGGTELTVDRADRPVLEFDGVTVRSDERLILENVSFSLWKGERALIRGPSGSGKSTLLQSIVGGATLDSGAVRFLGKMVEAVNIQEVRRQVSFVGQEPLLSGETAREGLLLPFTFQAHRSSRPGQDRISEVLSGLGLEGTILDQPVGSLSGGEKQRLALARALLLESRLFVLDEVTSALDLDSSRMAWRVLRERDVTLIAVSHQVPEGSYFHRTWTLERGKLFPADNPQ
jgi:putative ABC transport system ATP-binding protein